MLWRHIQHGASLRRVRFVSLYILLLAITIWGLWPLREASTLPFPSWPSYTPNPPDQQETLFLDAPSSGTSALFAPGTQRAVRVMVYDPGAGSPLAGAQVRVSLARPGVPDGEQYLLYEGVSDGLAAVPAVFHVPSLEAGAWNLLVDVQGPVGEQRIVRPVTVRREDRLDLSTDRPTYLPGQTLSFWMRALDASRALPLSDQPVSWSVANERGTVICSGEAHTSTYGIAHASCRLAERIRPGTYLVSAALGDSASQEAPVVEQRVRVDQGAGIGLFHPSRFDIELLTDEAYALAGQPFAATVQATYLWGQPVAGARVRIYGALDLAPGIESSTLAAPGETDEAGVSRLVLDLDDVALEHTSVTGTLHLTARVTNVEGHAQEIERWLPVAGQALLIQVHSPSGPLKAGIDNPIDVRVTYPDGRPAACTLDIEAFALGKDDRDESGSKERDFGERGSDGRAPGGRAPGGAGQLETGADGWARLYYRPPEGAQDMSLVIAAYDAQGVQARERVELPILADTHVLAIQPDRRTYRPGETAHIVLTFAGPDKEASPSAVYLDVVRGGELVAVYAAPLEGGHGALDVPLSGEWSGPIELRAYAFPAESPPVVDARQIAVEPTNALAVTVRTDRERYAPGDTARVSIHVDAPHGQGQQSVLSVAVTPADAQARVPAWGAGVRGSSLPGGKNELHLASAGVLQRTNPTPTHVVEAFEEIAAIRAARQRAFSALAGRLIGALVLLAGLLGVSALGDALSILQPEREVRRTIRALAAGTLGALVLLPLLVLGGGLLTYGSSRLFGPGAVIVLGLTWFAVLLALVIDACQRGNGWTHVLWVAVICALALGAGLYHALGQGATITRGWIACGLGGLGVSAVAFCILAITRMRRGARAGASATWALVIALLVTVTGALLAGVPPQEERPPLLESAVVTRSAPSTMDQVFQVPQAARVDLSPPARLGTWAAGQRAARPDRDAIYWQPQALTDERGLLAVDVPIPEHAVGQREWELSVVASDARGGVGEGHALLSASRLLWIETSLPGELSVGDELDLPITVYNGSPLSQTVQITTTVAPWFQTRVWGTGVQRIEVGPRDAGEITVPIRVREWGVQHLEVVAQSKEWRDVLSQEVNVTPGGLRLWRVYDGQVQAASPPGLRPGDDLLPDPAALSQVEGDEPPPETRFKFRVPWSAVRGSDRVTVTLYSNWESTLAESLEAINVPTSWPQGETLDAVSASIRANALFYAYLHGKDALPADAEADLDRIRENLALGYQRLLSFEAPAGGFAALGQAPPDVYHTAEALSCLSELAHLVAVDKALIERTAQWLFQEQTNAGTWLPGRVPPSWQSLPRQELPATAYAAWSLIEAGYGDAPEVRLAIEHLARYPDKAEDPYALALVANALVAYEGTPPMSSYEEILDATLARLADGAEREGASAGTARWQGTVETFSGAVRDAAAVESTALALYALLQPQRELQSHSQLVNEGLTWLAGQRDGTARWGSSQTNWLAVRTLFAAVQGVEAPFVSSTVSVTVNEVEALPIRLRSNASREGAFPRQAQDGVQSRVFDELSKGYNDVVLSSTGLGEARYRAVGTYILPWNQVEPSTPEEEEVSIEVRYDRTQLAVGETMSVTVDVMLNRPGSTRLAVLELGLPPGLENVEDQWQELVESGVALRCERHGERMVVYLADLSAEEPVQFAYRLRARFPLTVWTLPTRAYDPANPRRAAVRPPVQITVLAEPET